MTPSVERSYRISQQFFTAAALIGAIGCARAPSVREATPADIRAFMKAQGKTVVTFLGYSAADYEDRAALRQHATAVLAAFDPATALVNIGATPDGIGAVYEIARARGFTTTGIVSTQARETNAALSPFVDHVFFVNDSTWGGFVDAGAQLSPTSAAMVEVSDHLIAIGGGDVARDELIGAQRAGKAVRFIAADMNHAIALDRAKRRGQPVPTDFGGSAATALIR